MFESGEETVDVFGRPVDPGAATAARVPSVVVQALVEAVDAVLAQTAVDLPAGQALTDTSVLLGQVERLRGGLLSRIADVDARNLHALDGSPSASSWVAAQQTSLDRGEVALARRLKTLPRLDAAVRDGLVSVGTAERVGRALSQLRRHVDRPDGLIDGQDGDVVIHAVVVDGVRQLVCEALAGLADDDPRLDALVGQLDGIAAEPVSQLARLEAAFLVLAAHVEPGLLPSGLARLVDALLPNELEKRAEDAHSDRGFHLRRKSDGSGWSADGDLDLETGELLHTVLQAELDVDPDNPADTAEYEQLRTDGWTAEQDLPTCGGPRSLRQRRHDALRNALRRYLDSGIAGLRDKVAPHLNVTVRLETLHGAPGALPAVAASGARIPRRAVAAWWCDSTLTRLVLSLGSRVLEVSHTARTLKAHERLAKRVETGSSCQGAGCSRGPGHRLIPHHADPWTACGTTSLSDTVLLCEQTHHQLHHGKHPSA